MLMPWCRCAGSVTTTSAATFPHVEVRLIDREDSDENPHLDFVLLEAVRAVEWLRGDGRKVLLHCVEALSRTLSGAALYGARLKEVGVDEALRAVGAVLPDALPNGAFRDALGRLDRSDDYIGPRVT